MDLVTVVTWCGASEAHLIKISVFALTSDLKKNALPDERYLRLIIASGAERSSTYEKERILPRLQGRGVPNLRFKRKLRISIDCDPST